MLADKICSAFHQDKNLRVLFLFDPTGENKDAVDALQLEDVRVEKFNGRWLYYKLLFSKEWKEEKVFFYFEQPSPKKQEELMDFQLLDLLCANRELVLDDVGDFMNQHRLQPHQESLVRRYQSELTRLQVIPVIAPLLNASSLEEKSIQQGLMSALLDFSKIESWEKILIRLLTYALPSKQKSLKTISNRISNVNPLFDALNRHIRDTFGIEITAVNEKEIISLIERLKYNLITQAFSVHNADPYKELKVNDSTCIQAMNLLYETAIREKGLSKNFEESFSLYGEAIKVDKIVALYGFDADYVYQTEDLMWEILHKMLEAELSYDLLNQKLNSLRFNLYLDLKEKGLLSNTISFLGDGMQLLNEIDLINGYVYDTPEEYINQYTERFYLIDTYYRKSILAYQALNMQTTPIDEILKELKKKIDKDYFGFTFRMNNEWLRCMKEHDFNYKLIQCNKQYDFYDKQVAPLQQKVAVVISDALRYEAAVELLGELHLDEKNVSTLSMQLASIPSTTKFGMANLLPSKTQVFNEGEILLNGEKVIDTKQREKVLLQRNESSRAITFGQITDNDKQQNRELFKSSVVYVYHDIIDNTGHKGAERDAFKAVETAVKDLAKLVKQIISGFNVAKVFVTADHGFLYNDFDIAETDKNIMEDNDIVESDARHSITKEHEEVSIGYKVPLFKVSKYQEPYYVVIPDSVNRFKKAGSRYRFTHGGGSLQELVIPVIECMRKEEKVQRKVDIVLSTSDRDIKIVSNTLRLAIAQKNPVSATEKERTIKIGIYENDSLVSNEAQLRLNSSDPKPSKREQSVTLVLNKKTSSTLLKLKVYDVDDMLNPLFERNVTNNTLMERDF